MKPHLKRERGRVAKQTSVAEKPLKRPDGRRCLRQHLPAQRGRQPFLPRRHPGSRKTCPACGPGRRLPRSCRVGAQHSSESDPWHGPGRRGRQLPASPWRSWCPSALLAGPRQPPGLDLAPASAMPARRSTRWRPRLPLPVPQAMRPAPAHRHRLGFRSWIHPWPPRGGPEHSDRAACVRSWRLPRACQHLPPARCSAWPGRRISRPFGRGSPPEVRLAGRQALRWPGRRVGRRTSAWSA